MRSAGIEKQAILSECAVQMLYAKDDGVIQAFASDATKESFANRIHQGHLNRCTQYLHPSALRNAIEFGPKFVVVIANDELGSFTERRDIPKLLGRPFRSWRTSNANVHNSLRIDIHDEERKDWPKPNIVSLQEIARPNRMVSQECSPSLAAIKVGRSGLGHVTLDCALRDSDAEFQEFAAYSLRAPEDIFFGHAMDDCDDLRVNPRSTSFGIFRFPTPEKPKSLAVPTEHRVWFHA